MPNDPSLNAVYSTRAMKRRYEVWFLRCGLANGSGAWWFRYLLLNLGRTGCGADPAGMPVQVWATWFPGDGKPQTFIQGFPAESLDLSKRSKLPFHLRTAQCGIEQDTCWGNLNVEGHSVSWRLRYRSDFGVVLSDKGWIGLSKSPHSNAAFSGEVTFDGRTASGNPVGFGVQGHNCGYRHRTYWRWMHACFILPDGSTSTLEALVYDMPFGLVFRKATWWHGGRATTLRWLKETEVVRQAGYLKWKFGGISADGSAVVVAVEAMAPGVRQIPYTKTDCSGTFPVANASAANAGVRFGKDGSEVVETVGGAVLEMGGA